jgi:hypothetical protein
MAVIKLVENWAVTQLRSQVRDSLQYHGEECILLSLYHAATDLDAVRCPRCSNDVYQQGEADCPVCYGTGFDGGVKDAKRVWGLFTDHIVTEQLGNRGEYQPDSREIQCEPFPMLIEHDVIVRVRRWEVDHTPAELEGFYIIQAVTKNSLRTGNRFGQTQFDVIGQKGNITRLADNLGITKFPILGVEFPPAEIKAITSPGSRVPVNEPDTKVVFVPADGPGGVFTFRQDTPSAVWVINHTINHLPQVTVVVGGEQVIADITLPEWPASPTPVVITFQDPQTGYVELV